MKCIEYEIPFDVPEGWAWARMSSLTQDLPYGTSKKSSLSGKIAVLRMGNLQQGEIDYTDLVYSSDKEDIDKYSLTEGDLLFNRTNSSEWVGKTAIYRGELAAIYAGYLIRIRPFLDGEYLNCVMNSGYIKEICLLVKTDAVNQSNINATKLGRFLIPVPPFNEQSRISKKAFEALYWNNFIVTEKLELGQCIQQIKSKILDLAIHGKLVPQNPNDEPASVLLERIREEKEELIKQGKIKRDKKESIIFKGDDNSYYETISENTICIDDTLPYDLPLGWSWCKLKSLSAPYDNSFVDGPFGSNLKTEHYTEKREVRIIQLNNIGEFVWRNNGVKYTTFEHAETLKRCISYPEDIVIAKMMPSGRTIIVPHLEKNYVISSDCVRLRLSEQISNKYVMYMLNSPTINSIISGDVHGIGRSRTSLSKLKEITIPLPPYNEQKRIVKAIETVFTQLDRIINVIS